MEQTSPTAPKGGDVQFIKRISIGSRQLVKLRFDEVFDGWIFTCMIVFIVTSYEPSALSWLAATPQMHPLARYAGLPPEGAASLGSPTGVAANMSCTSEHNLKEQSDAQIVVSR